MSKGKIQKIIAGFGKAAVLAKQAGFDMVQVHGDRMCGSFSSSIFNQRTDEYGGSAENRARFAMEAVSAVRAAVPGMPIDYKLAVRQEKPHFGNGKQIFLFGTAGFGGREEYFNKILKAVQRSLDKSNTVFGSFMCQGKMPMSVRQRYEDMKQQPIHLPNLDAMIENFDQALTHPDAEDLERLKQAVK